MIITNLKTETDAQELGNHAFLDKHQLSGDVRFLSMRLAVARGQSREDRKGSVNLVYGTSILDEDASEVLRTLKTVTKLALDYPLKGEYQEVYGNVIPHGPYLYFWLELPFKGVDFRVDLIEFD